MSRLVDRDEAWHAMREVCGTEMLYMLGLIPEEVEKRKESAQEQARRRMQYSRGLVDWRETFYVAALSSVRRAVEA